MGCLGRRVVIGKDVFVAKRPTIYDVARRASVSIATVSFTFRQPQRVSEATRRLVTAAARDLGYVPSASARGLASGRTGAIGLYSYDYYGRAGTGAASLRQDDSALLAEGVFSDKSNEDFRLFPLYHDEVQRGVEMECRRRGYVLMIGEGRGKASEADINEIAGRVDGLAVFPNTFSAELLKRIASRIPVVELAVPAMDTGQNCVFVENAFGARELTRHLIRHHGHTSITFVGPAGSPDREHRFAGYSEAMQEAGLKTASLAAPGRDPEGKLKDPLPDPARESDEAVRRLQGAGSLPDAFVCSNDAEALLFVDALKRAGLSVPGDVAVTGFDGLAAGRMSRPALTTVRQPMIALGRAAAEILIDRISTPGGEAVSRELPVDLVLSESCGCR